MRNIGPDELLKKNTLKCNISIDNNKSPFSHKFNSSELEFGNSYDFLIRTLGCEEDTLCQVDSEKRSFEMSPDAVSSSFLAFNNQSNSIIVTSQRLPSPVYDNITIFCESTDRKRNSNSTGLCTENSDVLAQSMRCDCTNLLPATQYDITISTNRRNKVTLTFQPTLKLLIETISWIIF